MKKIVLWFATTLTIVVLLFGYRTSTNTTSAAAATSAISPYTGTAPTSAAAPSTTAGNTITAPSGAAGTGSAASSTSSSAAATTYTGDVASTRWGDVQVAITVADGKITAVAVPVYPTENGKDQQINARALPILVQETISNQNASIDMVSGATVTSDGYLESLQSALDQAGL